jgi:adenosine kinase
MHRSLCTTLRAAEKFEKSHLESPEVAPLIAGAKFYYVEGYFLTHGTESIVEVAKKSSEEGKVGLHFISNQTQSLLNLDQVFALNLSAPFIPQFFQVQLQQVLPYTDIIFGNEAEAAAWASATGQPPEATLPEIAKALASQPKSNPSRPRTVVFTQGPKSTIVVTSDAPDAPKVYDVHPLKEEQIIDTNAAGDGFAGGFMGALVAGRNIDECVEVGHKMGAMVVQQVGPQYKYPKEKIL